MRNPQGHSYLVGPGLSNLKDEGLASLNQWGECDTFTCGHCQRIVHVPAMKDPACIGGLCRVCNRLVCPTCADKQECLPFEELLERNLIRQYRLKEY